MTRPVVQDIWCWLESANKPYKGSSLKHIISNIDKITRCVCQQSNNQKDVIKRTTEKQISSKETNMNVTKFWLLTNSNKHSHEKLLATYTSDYSTSGITSSKWTVQRFTKLDEIASFSARMASPRCSWIDARDDARHWKTSHNASQAYRTDTSTQIIWSVSCQPAIYKCITAKNTSPRNSHLLLHITSTLAYVHLGLTELETEYMTGKLITIRALTCLEVHCQETLYKCNFIY